MLALITGSQGFVGKQLTIELKANGFDVREFDLVLGNDLLNPEEAINACKGVDIIFHLGAMLDEDSRLLEKINVKGTKNILEASAQAKAKQFVFLSSVGVHGKNKKIISEESKIAPETRYEKSKADGEKIVLEYQELLHITIIRSALVMGANPYWENILNLVKNGFPLPGKAKNVFQTIYIKDLVSALLFVANNKECFGETFIVAGKEKPTLREICCLARKELGLKPEIRTIPVFLTKTIAWANLAKNRVFGKKSLFEPAYLNRILHERNYDTSKINKLGWQPSYPVETALRETILQIKP